RQIHPDLLIANTFAQVKTAIGGASAIATIEPVKITLPMPEEVKELYVPIRDRKTQNIVTVIEVLSPTNKRAGSYDRTLYLAKRDEVVLGEISLVELDLLRGGRRLPSEEPLPPADFYAIVSRAGERPCASAYPWT